MKKCDLGSTRKSGTENVANFSRYSRKIWFRNGAKTHHFIFVPLPPRQFFFTLAPPPRAPPFLVRASGVEVLKVAQVPSTAIWHNIWVQFFLLYTSRMSATLMKLSLMTMGLFQWRDAREIVALVATYILTSWLKENKTVRQQKIWTHLGPW